MLIERGILGVLLAGAVLMLIYTVRRFITYLESQSERHVLERSSWLEFIRTENALTRTVLEEHSKTSVQMYGVLQEMHEDLRRMNGH